MLILVEELFVAVRRHFRIAVGSFLLVMAFVAVIIVFAPRKYQSRAKMMVRVGRESVILDPTTTSGGNMLQLHRTSEHEMNTAVAGMSSRAILENVVDDVGIESVLEGYVVGEDSDPSNMFSEILSSTVGTAICFIKSFDPVSDREEAVIELEEGMEIKAPAESSVVSVRFEAKSPKLAQMVVDRWLENYISQHVQVSQDATALDFLTAQADVLMKKLSDARTLLQSKKDESGLVTVPGQQAILEQRLKMALDQVTDVESELFAINRRSEVLRGLIGGLDAEMVVSKTSGLGDDAYEGIVQEIFKFEADQKGLAVKMTDNHPRRRIVDEQVKQLKEKLSTLSDDRESTVLAANPTFQELQQMFLVDQAQAAGLEKKLETARAHYAELEQSIRNLNREENEIAALTREVEILESQYRVQAERVEQARFERALTDNRMSSISILQPASFEEKPVSPKKVLCLLLGGMSATCAFFGLPFFLYDRERIRKEQQLSDQLARTKIDVEPANVTTDRVADKASDDASWDPDWAAKPADEVESQVVKN